MPFFIICFYLLSALLVLFFSSLSPIHDIPFYGILYGMILYQFTFVAHECAHNSMFSSKKKNYLFGVVFTSFLFSSFTRFRSNHFLHHKYLWSSRDPQLSDYNIPFTFKTVFFHLISPLLLYPLFTKLKDNFFDFHFSAYASNNFSHFRYHKILPEISCCFLLQLLILYCFSFSSFISYPLLLLFSFPVVLFLSRLRSYLEHGRLSQNEKIPITRSHSPWFFEYIIFTGLNFSFHIVHHQFPNLRFSQLTSRSKSDPHTRQYSYLASLIKLFINLTSINYIAKLSESNEFSFPTSSSLNCQFCGSSSFEYHSSSFDYEYSTSSSIRDFARCKDCSNITINPMLSNQELSVAYPPNYYSYNYNTQANNFLIYLKSLLDIKRLSTFVSRFNIAGFDSNSNPLCYLDVGCGNGRYLSLMKRYFNADNIFGTEYSSSSVNALVTKGYNVTSDIFSASFLPESFSFITMFSVLEHINTPFDCLKRCNELLCDEGILLVEVPNPLSTNSFIFSDSFWGGYHTPRHLHIPSVYSLDILCRATNFEVLQVVRSTGHAFWLWSLHHYVTYGLNLRFLGNIFNPLKFWPGVLFFTFFDMLRIQANHETDNNIFVLRKIKSHV